MPPPLESNLLTQQRTLLECLMELTTAQALALHSGDLSDLAQLSQSRTRAIREAAGFLPPTQPWHPELTELVTQVQAGSETLQQGIRACMAEVRRELVDLTRREQVTNYLTGTSSGPKASWNG